ncbi:MAG: glycosyltransferase family 2 protein, partial [Bacteroidota bacterium]
MEFKISVIITTNNRNSLLKETLTSLLAQSFQSWEALIVDNNCSDNSAYTTVNNFKDERLRYLTKGRNLGECGGRNFGILNSCGQYVCYLDDDDLLPEYSLSSRYEFAQRYLDSGMIYGEYKKFTTIDNIELNPVNDENELLKK